MFLFVCLFVSFVRPRCLLRHENLPPMMWRSSLNSVDIFAVGVKQDFAWTQGNSRSQERKIIEATCVFSVLGT